MTKITPRHDRFFRKALEIPMVAKDLMESYLPANVIASMNMNSIKVEKDSFIEPDLSSSICDVLLSVKENGLDSFVYVLLEHQSTVDPLMAFRINDYIMSICKRYLKQNTGATKLPMVYPIIIYNGTEAYTAARNIFALFPDEEKARQVLTQDHLVVDVSKLSDSEIKRQQFACLMLFLFKHIRDSDVVGKWEEISVALPDIMTLSVGCDYIIAALHYSLTYVKKEDRVRLEIVLKENTSEEEAKVMIGSLAESWFMEGEAKGIRIGEAKGIRIGEAKGIRIGEASGIRIGEAKGETRKALGIAKKLLADGWDLAYVASTTELDEQFIAANI